MENARLNMLPITINSRGLFDGDETRQAPLFVKLEAWFNYQALTLSWYHDEANIQTFEFVFIADKQLDEQFVDPSKNWQISQIDATQVLTAVDQSHTHNTLILASEDLKQLMDGRYPVESFFRTLLLRVINPQAKAKWLPIMTEPDTQH